MDEKITYWYGRNSTDKQDDSQYQQFEVCSKWAKERGYIITKKFYDDGYSGTTLERPALKDMLKEMEKDRPTYLLVYHTDRLARDLLNGSNLFHSIEGLGVTILSVTEPMMGEESATARLTRNLNLSVAQYHVDNAKQLVCRAMKSKARRNEFNGGVPPYGFKIVNKKYAIDESEAPAIRIIFQMVANNYSYKEISEVLNEKGFRLRSGKTFSERTIFYDFIVNKKYKGVYVYGKTQKDSNNKYNQHMERPISEQIVNQGGVPAIVSEKLWDSANRIIDSRRRRNGAGSAKEHYLLSGLIKCSCGCNMVGNRTTSHKGKYVFISYRCSSKSNVKNSNCKDIKRDLIEQYIVKNLKFYFCDDIAVKVITYVANYTIKKYFINNENEIKQAKERLKGIEKTLANLVNILSRIECDENIDALINRMKGAEMEKKNLINEIERLQTQENKPFNEINETDIKNYLSSMFTDMICEHERRRVSHLISKSVKKVVVDNEKVQITYDLDFVFSGLNQLAELSVIIMKSELSKEIKTLWYQFTDIGRDRVKVTIKLKRAKEKRQLIFRHGNNRSTVSL